MSLQRQAWAAKGFAMASWLAGKLQSLPNRLTPPPFRLMQIGSAFWQSRALHLAATLDLASLLGDKTMSCEELASHSQTDPEALFRLLRLLAAMGVFRLDGERNVTNNKLSQPLRSAHPASVRSMVLMHNSPPMSRPWFEQLEAGIRTGQTPFRLCHGKGLYEYMGQDAGFDALFASAMDEVEALGGDSFATAFNWKAFDRLIDVGGSKGAKSMAILRRHPHLRACVVDRVELIRKAREAVVPQADEALRARMDFIEGDALGLLPGATGPRDVYLLSAVLHGFDDETCVRILRNVAGKAASGGAPIIVMELVVPGHRADLSAASFDMQMLMGTEGRERTLTQWRTLFSRSAVELTEVVHLASFGKMLVLRALPEA